MWKRSGQAQFNLDHTFDEMNNVREMKERRSFNSSISTISRSNLIENEEIEHPRLLETAAEKSSRKRSHWIVYLTTLSVSIGFSIVLTGVYPYLKLLANDPNLSKVKSGIVIACNPLGQLIASPIAGHVGNKLGGIRYVCYFTMVCFALGSILYGMLPALDDLWEDSAYHLMILSRFIVGLSSSNISLCRSYIAQSTTLKERTAAISFISASQALGFIIGPALQVILNLTLEDDMWKYRSTGFLSTILAVINILLFTPFIFKEYNISARETIGVGMERIKLPKTDYLALAGVLFGFFLVQFVYVLIESLMEPLMLDQYAWCDNMSVIVVGVCLMIGGFFSIFIFILVPVISKLIGERIVLIGIGFVLITIGVFLFIPWGPNGLKYCSETDETTTMIWMSSTTPLSSDKEENYRNVPPVGIFDFSSTTTEEPDLPSIYDNRTDLFIKLCPNITECLGCPPTQDWCVNVPQLHIIQFLVAFFVIITGYPFGLSMSNSIFSKILGPKPQGTWMGILTATGSFARVLGPVFVSVVYASYGTIYTFSILCVAMVVGMIVLLALYKRLIPMKVPSQFNENKF